MQEAMHKWGSGSLKGWRLSPELGREQERSARALVLAAVDAASRGDLYAEADIWKQDLDGQPAWLAISMALQARAETIIAAAAEAGADELVEALGGDDPFSMTSEELTAEQTAKRMHKFEETPWGFECSACGQEEPKADDWAPWDGAPKLGGCSVAAVPEVVAEPRPKGDLEPKPAPVGNFEGLTVGAQKVIAPGKPPARARSRKRKRKPAAPAEDQDEHAGADFPGSAPPCKLCAGAGTLAIPRTSRDQTGPATKPCPECQEPEALVACESCPAQVDTSATIVDSFGVRRCGDCHEKRVGPPKGEPDGGTDPSDGDAGSERSGEGEERPPLGDPCPACTGRLPCSVSGPCGGSRYVAAKEEVRPEEAGGFTVEPEEPDEPEGGLPAYIPCADCGHVGMHHDFRTKKCAECKEGCAGYVAKTMPDVDPNQQEFPKRWAVSCPACPANMTTGADPTGKPCKECAFAWPIVKVCGERSDDAFDWSRFLLRAGVLGLAASERVCKVSGDKVEKGERVWFHKGNANSVAHEGCVSEELGYAAVMLREGELVDAELNPAAAEEGKAVKEPCMVCGSDVEPGERCYANGAEGHRTFAHFACVQGGDRHPPIGEHDTRDLCAWNPSEGRAFKVGDPFHALATLIVGGTAKTRIRLCVSCRAMKPHSRLRKEVTITAPAGQLADLPF